MSETATPFKLNPEQEAHTQKVAAHIRDIIQRDGPMSFADYMALALYAPGLGYYAVGTQKFGASGDFVTAPEISPLFSRCLARQCAQVLTQHSGDILEFGAGSGVMAADLLTELSDIDSLPANYYIIEVSPDLRQRQQDLLQERCPTYFPQISWLDKLPEKPISGVVLANEVLDAMPVDVFTVAKGLVYERCVTVENDQFAWTLVPAKGNFKKFVQTLDQIGEDYTSEMSFAIPAWLKSIAGVLENGLVLLIDYGFPQAEFYHPERSMGTLMCHFAHQAHSNPLMLPGVQDITAHVNFTAVADAGYYHGFDVRGFTTQAAFLINCGLLDMIQVTEDQQQQMTIANSVKTLTLPTEMGELFKVIALGKNMKQPLLGFMQGDMLHRL